MGNGVLIWRSWKHSSSKVIDEAKAEVIKNTTLSDLMFALAFCSSQIVACLCTISFSFTCESKASKIWKLYGVRNVCNSGMP